jgi:hypothetical protein
MASVSRNELGFQHRTHLLRGLMLLEKRDMQWGGVHWFTAVNCDCDDDLLALRLRLRHLTLRVVDVTR